MPEKSTTTRAKNDLREGKSPSTAAGEFVHEEIEHIREGKHGARSPQQAIAIGLSKARRAGIPLPPPGKGHAKEGTRKSAIKDYEKGQEGSEPASPKRSQARERVLQRESHRSATRSALSKQTKMAARKRTPESRHVAAMKAVATKGKEGRRSAARKAAQTRRKKADS